MTLISVCSQKFALVETPIPCHAYQKVILSHRCVQLFASLPNRCPLSEVLMTLDFFLTRFLKSTQKVIPTRQCAQLFASLPHHHPLSQVLMALNFFPTRFSKSRLLEIMLGVKERRSFWTKVFLLC